MKPSLSTIRTVLNHLHETSLSTIRTGLNQLHEFITKHY
jgi:hypothetical protein